MTTYIRLVGKDIVITPNDNEYRPTDNLQDIVRVLKAQLAVNMITDMVSNFLFYDRPSEYDDDDDLARGEIKRMIENNQLTVDELVDAFREQITSGIS